jgi:phosphoribosyl 1,2-cyclic phosphate phosphodiesterase
MLREGVQRLDGIVFTHEHKDHVAGLDDIRAFNYSQQEALNVYAHKRVQESLKREFHYAFAEIKYPGVPLINLYDIDNKPFSIEGIDILPIEVMHHNLPVLGFRIGGFTYITDAKTVSDPEKKKIAGSKILVLNALQKDHHISHFTLDEAIAFAREAGAEKTYFTHISHKLGKHEEVSKLLPEGIELAYDQMVFEI